MTLPIWLHLLINTCTSLWETRVTISTQICVTSPICLHNLHMSRWEARVTVSTQIYMTSNQHIWNKILPAIRIEQYKKCGCYVILTAKPNLPEPIYITVNYNVYLCKVKRHSSSSIDRKSHPEVISNVSMVNGRSLHFETVY